MIQTDVPVVPIPDEVSNPSQFFQELKGLGLDEIVTKIANGMVSFAFKIILAIVVFYVGRFIIKKLYGAIYNVLTHRKIDASLSTFVLSLLKTVAYFILVITIIGILGIETSSFLALFASAGVALGMALSGTLQNFAGGVIVLLLKPYKVGDYIEAQGFAGTVKSIQLFNTVINTVDNKTIIIPNGALSTASINNYSVENYRRVDWTVALSYDTDYAKAREVILSILGEDKRIVKQYVENDVNKIDRSPFVGLNELADSSINLAVRAWTKSSDYWALYFDMNERFFTELPKHGFSFPFPQMDVHLDSVKA